jgi:hypothetical protein
VKQQYLEDVKEQAQQEEADQHVREVVQKGPQKNQSSTYQELAVTELFEMRSEYLYSNM